MNTPRSKEPKRYSHPPIGQGRLDGTYTAGLWSDRHCKLVGQIATYWTTIEDQMIEFLRDLMGGDQKLPARQIFRSIQSNQARKKLLETVLEKSEINKHKNVKYDDLIASFYSLNGRRNSYVHGFWQTYQDGETAFMSTESADDMHLLSARLVPVSELEALVKDMDELSNELLELFLLTEL